jgi:ribosomal protein S18 acetylase RimI-like enzyme
MHHHIEIRPLATQDLRFAVALHTATLPHGLFVRLGPGWLRAYYRTFVDSPHGIALLALLDGLPVGMLVGAASGAAHGRWVWGARGRRLVARGLAALAIRPRAVALLVRTRGRRLLRRLGGRGPSGPAGPQAVLTYLCVAEPARGLGVGAALVEQWVEEARRAGADRAMLVTPGGDEGASGFYRRLGWTYVTEQRSRDGWPVRMFSRPLDPGLP